jgi:toxin ParE1/3/4
MTHEVILHSEAEIEVLEALDWYADRSALVARAFVHELNLVIVRAAQSPESWPKVFGGARRIVFPHFPFNLVFRMNGDVVEIVAVAHQRRRPSYWRNR